MPPRSDHGTPYDVYIGRSGQGKDGPFGNPFVLRGKAHEDRAACLALFVSYFLNRVQIDQDFRRAVLALRGKRLGCFCDPSTCHGHVMAAWIDETPEEFPL